MLFSLGHGQHILLPSDGQTESGVTPPATVRMGAVAPGAKMGKIAKQGVEAGLSGTDAQSFGYMFPDADGVPGDDTATVDALKALAQAMVEAANDPAEADSSIAPIFTYFGQFIDHDITANTDRDAPQPNPISQMTGAAVAPLARADVVTNIMNLRNGSLRLDSLYGEGPTETPFTLKMKNALRDPSDRAKMRIGQITGPIPGFQPIPLPADGGADLPRLGQLVDDPASGLSQADLEALPEGTPTEKAFKEGFIKNGVVNRARAAIGDGRNDENLIVAQLHLAFLRFHNAVADDLKAMIPDAETRFVEAKRRTTMVYQWLVVNVYLPKICMPSVVDAVKQAGAPLYRAFNQRVASAADELALPLEFSAACFRFGHSMVRGGYDHNRNFGRPAGGGNRRATFRELFSFTGGDNLGQTAIGASFDKLPSNWPIEWDRFALDTASEADHHARKIDTKLAPPLTDMFKESGDAGELGRILRNLAERNLRRGHKLNIPCGQAAVAAVNAFDQSSASGVEASAHQVAYAGNLAYKVPTPPPPEEGIAVLPEEVLSQGATGAALSQGGMLDKTPLWFYILKEAEVTAGDTLGPLGSRIVAETLVGLAVQDDTSYWHESGGNGSWTPAQMPVGGVAITDFPKMLASCGLMA
jgi:hypothetical protein